VTVSIAGVTTVTRYYQFPTAGTRTLTVLATRGVLRETTKVTVPVTGTPLEFRSSLTTPVVTQCPVLQASPVAGTPYTASFTVGAANILPPSQEVASGDHGKAGKALPVEPARTLTPNDALGQQFVKVLPTLGNPDMAGSSAWQNPGDGNAVSPDNILYWNPPFYGYAEPLQYLPQHTEQYTVSRWKQDITRGSVRGTVRLDDGPVPNAHVWGFQPDGTTFTGTDGSYTLSNVPIGGLAADGAGNGNGRLGPGWGSCCSGDYVPAQPLIGAAPGTRA
jgi:hypothetical protein